MDKGTFGSIVKIKSLDYLTEKISEMNLNDKAYISKFIQEFNLLIKKIKQLNDPKLKMYVLELTLKDYLLKIDKHISNKHDVKFVTYLKNYITTKIKYH